MKIPRWMRAVIAVALLLALFTRVDWTDLLLQVKKFSWPVIAVTLLLLISQLVTSALKWHFSLRIHDLHFQLLVLLRVVSAAFFLNNFLPSAIGGDGYRIWRTITPGGGKLRPTSAVLLDRVVGLLAMLFLGAIGALFLRETNSFAKAYLACSIAGVLFALLLGLAFRLGLLASLLARLETRRAFKTLFDNMRLISKPRMAWVHLIAFSLIFQGTSAIIFYVMFRDIGVEVELAGCALLAVGAGLAAILPISINGIGVVEGSVAGVAVALGIPYEAAIVVPIAIRLLLLPVSALCGLIYLYDSRPLLAEPRAAD